MAHERKFNYTSTTKKKKMRFEKFELDAKECQDMHLAFDPKLPGDSKRQSFTKLLFESLFVSKTLTATLS